MEELFTHMAAAQLVAAPDANRRAAVLRALYSFASPVRAGELQTLDGRAPSSKETPVKDAVLDIVGKTISGVIVKNRTADEWLRHQIFIFLADGTYFEFYGGDINGIGHLRHGTHEDISRGPGTGDIVLEHHTSD